VEEEKIKTIYLEREELSQFFEKQHIKVVIEEVESDTFAVKFPLYIGRKKYGKLKSQLRDFLTEKGFLKTAVWDKNLKALLIPRVDEYQDLTIDEMLEMLVYGE